MDIVEKINRVLNERTRLPQVGDKVTFQGKDWEVLEVKGRYLKLVDKEGKEITTVEKDSIQKKIEEVIDPDYKPGGRYYRIPAESYVDKATGATVTKKEGRSAIFYNIEGTKEQVDNQIKLLQREFPATGYGTSTKRVSDTEAIVSRAMSAH